MDLSFQRPKSNKTREHTINIWGHGRAAPPPATRRTRSCRTRVTRPVESTSRLEVVLLDGVVLEDPLGEVVDGVFGLELAHLDEPLGERKGREYTVSAFARSRSSTGGTRVESRDRQTRGRARTRWELGYGENLLWKPDAHKTCARAAHEVED